MLFPRQLKQPALNITKLQFYRIHYFHLLLSCTVNDFIKTGTLYFYIITFKRFHSINYMYNNDTMKPFFRKVAYHCSAII